MLPRIDIIINFIEEYLQKHKKWDIDQIFFTRSFYPDEYKIIYNDNDVEIRHCEFWQYIEVLNLTEEEVILSEHFKLDDNHVINYKECN